MIIQHQNLMTQKRLHNSSLQKQISLGCFDLSATWTKKKILEAKTPICWKVVKILLKSAGGTSQIKLKTGFTNPLVYTDGVIIGHLLLLILKGLPTIFPGFSVYHDKVPFEMRKLAVVSLENHQEFPRWSFSIVVVSTCIWTSATLVTGFSQH